MVSHNCQKTLAKPQRPQGIESVQAASVSTYLVSLWLADPVVKNGFDTLKHAMLSLCADSLQPLAAVSSILWTHQSFSGGAWTPKLTLTLLTGRTMLC